MISHPAVRRINFTGSTRVGRLLAQQAAKHLKPILLELGGKAPLVVLDDADLDAAISATVFGAYANQGQICMSTERVIVHERIADEFASLLAKRVAALPVGDPRQGEFVLASVVGRRQSSGPEDSSPTPSPRVRPCSRAAKHRARSCRAFSSTA